MILTCPECATRYFVDDEKVGPEGRSVKCASCGHRWTAKKPPRERIDLTPAAPADPTIVLRDQGDYGATEHEPEPLAPPPAEVSELPGEELPKVFRQKADNDRKAREAAAVGVVWAGMTAALAVVIAVAVMFRTDVVRIWPKAASVYAMTPFRVNPQGLTLENVTYAPVLQGGHAALSVSGLIRNVEDRTITAPPLKVVLLNSAGDQVGGKVAAPENPKIPPGETRRFTLILLDPPSNGVRLEISFVDDPKAAGAVRAAVHLPEPGGAAAGHGETGEGLRGKTDGHGEAAPEAEGHAPAAEPLPQVIHGEAPAAPAASHDSPEPGHHD